MNESMTLWQLLITPISWHNSQYLEEARLSARLLRKHRKALGEVQAQAAQLLKQIEYLTQKRDAENVLVSATQLSETINTIHVLENLLPESVKAPNLFIFSSWMLCDSFKMCTASPEEGMLFIVGVEFDGLAIGTRIIPFGYAYRSIIGAAGDHQDTHRICISTHEAGHRILALIHSHPGTGIKANYNSSVDARTQELWELTTKMVGGIWSRDGYLRFFSSKLPFAVKVIGEQMEQINDVIFKLKEDVEL